MGYEEKILEKAVIRMRESKVLKLDRLKITYPYQGEAKCGGSDITG